MYYLFSATPFPGVAEFLFGFDVSVKFDFLAGNEMLRNDADLGGERDATIQNVHPDTFSRHKIA